NQVSAVVFVPLLVPPEEEFVSLDWTGNEVAIVIAPEWRLGTASNKRVVSKTVSVQFVVTAFIKNTAVKLVFAGTRGDADDCARRLPILWAIRIGEHLEFGNGIHGRIDKDCSVGAYVVVVHAVDQEQVVGAGIAIHRKIRAALQSFILRIKPV